MTSTLTEPQRTAREDGISGYAVALMGDSETSSRESLEIISYFDGWNLKLSIDRIVTITTTTKSDRIKVYSERNVEMICFPVQLGPGDRAVLYPAGHPDAPEGLTKVFRS